MGATKTSVLLFLALSACAAAPPRAPVEDSAECNKQAESISNPKSGLADEAWIACVRDRGWRDCAIDACASRQKDRSY